MNPDMVAISARQTQETISHIGAKIADAMEVLQHSRQLSAKPILIKAQLELEELYLSLEPEGSSLPDKKSDTDILHK